MSNQPTPTPTVKMLPDCEYGKSPCGDLSTCTHITHVDGNTITIGDITEAEWDAKYGNAPTATEALPLKDGHQNRHRSIAGLMSMLMGLSLDQVDVEDVERSEPWSEEEWFTAEIAPMVKKMHDMMKEKNVPFMFVSTYAKDEESDSNMASIFTNERASIVLHRVANLVNNNRDDQR